ncbi:ABC transporter ATP-binding protein [Anaeromyxobacter diazotrophicus]|uniref:ABC transporter ATP-binding protein n=1 Tax=Anaeromyxobacter diazotrophicus TaxID=2590199 RepID=A0A7I9VNK3_9BACT|nr:ABC transporter ATP-binding protein [Anaeromyxobacter diazotrophicus]GEJ57778.1 ABC transporter ATP-binding protein [Anaeromyxobacter diazotrophicus]
MREAIVSVQEVSKVYRLGKTEVRALSGVSLEIEQGEFLAIAGPSGSGKTTLLNLVGCMDTPTAGSVSVAGQPTASLGERALTELRLRRIGFVFQTFNLVAVLSVEQNVELPLLLQGGRARRERRARVAELLARVGLDAHARHRPSELSGGQRQRVAIARALVGGPALVLADEPTANLDSRTGGEVVDLMKELNQRDGTTFVFSTHDPRVMGHASRLVEIADGRLVAPAEPRALGGGA